MILRAVSALERGNLDATPQPSVGVTYATKIDKAEARIDFTRPAQDVHNQIRALSPFPGAWFELAAGEGRAVERVKVLRSVVSRGDAAPGTALDADFTIACGTGAVRLVELQRAGKKPMAAADFKRGFPLTPGVTIG